MARKYAFVDREWGTKEKEIHGDMGWTFSERLETATTAKASLKKDVERWAMGEDAVLEHETYEDGEFCIYLFMEAETSSLLSPVLTDIFACATREQAGWIEEQYKGNVKFHYRKV